MLQRASLYIHLIMHSEKPGPGQIALFFLLLLTSALLLQSCGNSADNVESMPDVLRVGVLPDDREEVLREQYTPLFDYLSTAVECDL